MKKMIVVLGILALAQSAAAAELVRGVRFKISAGDLFTGAAQVEDYKKTKGVDAEYLDAVGWLARGAEMFGRRDLAREYVAELRREIRAETPELLVPLGAAIEVEGRLIAARDGRGAAIRFFESELARASAPALRSRIGKNINLLSLEGQPAPALGASPSLASLRGKPVLLFFWAQWCGDCKSQAATLARIWQTYKGRGLAVIAPTRLYGTVAEKPATPEAEKAEVQKVWKEVYTGLEDVPIVIDTDAMVRYGASATPTFALVDRAGVVRMYTPTRLSEAELARRIEEVLVESAAPTTPSPRPAAR
jgi:thiol-disulfide isomerase/thioredoxin